MTLCFRIIARLDIKAPHLVKGVRMEGLRKIGDPVEYARRYYEQGADEIHIHDYVASVYGRPTSLDIVRQIAAAVFVPVTVGGGLRTLDDMKRAIKAGAEKVCINTAAIERPEIVTEAAKLFGSQAISVNIEVNALGQCMTSAGRESTRRTSIEYALGSVQDGAGEIVISSIDRDGTYRGFDIALARRVSERIRVPVVIHGGCSGPSDIRDAYSVGCSGCEIASMLHYNRATIGDLKAVDGVPMRPITHA